MNPGAAGDGVQEVQGARRLVFNVNRPGFPRPGASRLRADDLNILNYNKVTGPCGTHLARADHERLRPQNIPNPSTDSPIAHAASKDRGAAALDCDSRQEGTKRSRRRRAQGCTLETVTARTRGISANFCSM